MWIPTMLLQVCVHRANQMLRDTVVWDVFQPYNTAQQYAASVCECLGLRFDWYKIIVNSVDSMLRDIWEVRIKLLGNTIMMVLSCLSSECGCFSTLAWLSSRGWPLLIHFRLKQYVCPQKLCTLLPHYCGLHSTVSGLPQWAELVHA